MEGLCPGARRARLDWRRRWLARPDRSPTSGAAHGRLLALCLALSAALLLRFLGGSDVASLVTSHVPDDSFYVLLPAWNASHGAGFTFDGQNTTYGVQPLWALIATLLGGVASTRAAHLQLVLGCGAILHLAAGVGVWVWLRRAVNARAALIAAALLLLGPDAIHLSTNGLESGLHLAALVLVLNLVPSVGVAPSSRRLLWLGVACALLGLARVSSLVAAGLLVLALARRPRSLAPFLLGFGLLLVPALLWAQHLFGQPLPSSMDRKLIGAFAALVTVAPSWLGSVLEPLLPASEQALVGASGLALPSWQGLFRLGLQAPVGWALGAFLPRLPWALIPILAGAGLLLAAPRRSFPPALRLLGALAVVNVLTNGLLLPVYVQYGYWYRIPEVLFVLVGAGIAVDEGLRRAPALPRWLGAVGLAVAAIPGAIALAPRRGPTPDATASGAWDLGRALPQLLPAGARVGSWNAGLLGWVADGNPIVNLDGLASSPAYVRDVARGEIAFRLGVSTDNPTLRWLDEQGIRYLIDLVPESCLHEPGLLFGVVPTERLELIATRAVDHGWSADDPRRHALVLVRLTPP